jgi:hypothetical protein
MAGTRKAHFLSRYYLGGFTPTGSKNDYFWVWDKARRVTWRMRAENAAHQRDLFRLSRPEFGKDDLEQAFGSVEGEIAPVLRQLIASRRLPTDARAMSLLLHLPALNAARPPAEIRDFETQAESAVRSGIVGHLTPELHEKLLSQWRAEGKDTTFIEDLEAVRQRITEGGVRAEFDRDFLLTMVLGRSAALVELLHNRNWTLLHASDPADYFICSDRPVSLLNNRNVSHVYSARFDDPTFDVVMPLAKDLALVGHVYGRSGTSTASSATVAFINHITDSGATDYVYSPTKSYFDTAKIPQPNWGESYKDDLRRARR